MELVERPSGDLDDAVVQGGLEGCGRPLGDRVPDLVQRLAAGDLRGDPGDWVSGGLGGERGGPGDPRVHLDHVVREGFFQVSVPGCDVWSRGEGELNVAAAFDPELRDYPKRGRAKHLVVLVAQRLGGRNHDGISCMDTHRVNVLHVADGDHVARRVTHHFVLNLFPADQVALHQHLSDRTGGKAGRGDRSELLRRERHATAGPAERVGGPHDDRQADLLRRFKTLLQAVADLTCQHRFADLGEHGPEELAVFGSADRIERCPQEAHIVLLEDAGGG